MKINLLFLLFVVIGNFAFTQEIKDDPSYTIDSIVMDKSLKEGQCTFVFTSKFLDITKSQKLIYSYNGSSNKTVTLDSKKQFSLTLAAGNYSFVFYHSGLYYEIYTNSISVDSQKKAFISLNWKNASSRIQLEKPVIYLYPEKLTDIEVKLHPKEEIIFTYPVYDNSWKFKADPSGRLTFGEQEYSYLFWEAEQSFDPATLNRKEGFVVSKERTTEFLDSTLTIFGFNDQEKEDFITYWGPQLIRNNNNFIHFIFNEDCDQFCKLEINPTPDNVCRFYMIFENLENGNFSNVKPQKIQPIKREGFTVFEWGGIALETKKTIN